MSKILLTRLAILSLCSLAYSQEISFQENPLVVDLKDPEFVMGVLRTEHGGIITAPGLRIQACTIEYTDKTINGQRVQKIVAEGNLLIEYEGRFYVGSRLDFDLIRREGTLLDGKTFIDIWFIGGEKIQLCEDGSFFVFSGYVTTSESPENAWELKAGSVRISPTGFLSARNLRLNLNRIPIFWLPAFKSSLKFFRDAPIRIRLLWDKGIGPRLSVRSRIYSWEDFNAYLRFDYRLKLGPGAALETEYYSPNECLQFVTRSYVAHDKSFPDEKGKNRFRFQGLLHSSSFDQRTNFHLQWDRFSDMRMISDFKDTDFEINTQKSTYLTMNHLAENAFGTLRVRPNINPFESLNQELPYVSFGIRPFPIWKTGIIAENFANAAFLDYTYPERIREFLHSRQSGRLETSQQIYRSFHLGPITCTPKMGLNGIFYTRSPKHHAIGQLTYNYGGDLSTKFIRCSEHTRHALQPYVSYLGYSRPQAPLDSHFVFDIHDGYVRLDQIRFGARNFIYRIGEEPLLPFIEFDFYSYAFFGARSFFYRVPKLYADFTLNRPSWAFGTNIGWNFQEHLLDRANVHFLWTINAWLALNVEFRHRSSFDWRKADRENYAVDFARPLSELLSSPLSDRRNTFLGKAHIRFSPRWNMQLETHLGWGRKHEPHYTGAKAELYTMLTSSWQLRVSYEYTPYDPFRISYHFRLIH